MRRFLPSISIALWLSFFLGLTLTNWRLVLINVDGDASLHWRIGDWMIEHRTIINTEQFSHTADGLPLLSKEWLGEIIYAFSGNFLGWNGFVLLAAMLIATYLCILHKRLLTEGSDILVSTGIVLITAFSCSMHWLARPHLVTHLFTVIYIFYLRDFDRGKLSGKQLAIRLVPLMLLWVNLHGAFFTGFVLIGAYLGGTCISYFLNNAGPRILIQRKLETLSLIFLACMLISFINPNTWHLHAHILEFLDSPILAKFSNEFRSPDFHSSGMRGFLLLLLTLGLSLIIARPQWSPTDLLLVGGWGFLALQSARNIPIFALVTAPILAEQWSAFLRSSNKSFFQKVFSNISERCGKLQREVDGRILIPIAIVVLTLIGAKPRIWGGNPILATEIMTNRFPVAAVKHLRDHPDITQGNMFNEYGWGGYLMLAMPEKKVFVDGRNDFYGETIMEDFNEADNVTPDWERVFNKYSVDWTILPKTHRLSTVLGLHPGWDLSYSDDVTSIYRKKNQDISQ